MHFNSFSQLPEDDEELHLPELVYCASLGDVEQVEQLLAEGTAAKARNKPPRKAMKQSKVDSITNRRNNSPREDPINRRVAISFARKPVCATVRFT